MTQAFVIAAVLSLATAACAPLVPIATEAPVRPPRNAISTFQLEGRIAVRSGAENFSAGIDWRHSRGQEEIVVSGPLGQGLARLSADAAGARLETAEQQRFEAADIDGLTERVFGARLPVSGMARWVLGRAAPGGAVTVDGAGRLARLSESGWVIDYLDYESPAADALPVLVRARREAVEVRLKIDSWSFAP